MPEQRHRTIIEIGGDDQKIEATLDRLMAKLERVSESAQNVFGDQAIAGAPGAEKDSRSPGRTADKAGGGQGATITPQGPSAMAPWQSAYQRTSGAFIGASPAFGAVALGATLEAGFTSLSNKMLQHRETLKQASKGLEDATDDAIQSVGKALSRTASDALPKALQALGVGTALAGAMGVAGLTMRYGRGQQIATIGQSMVGAKLSGLNANMGGYVYPGLGFGSSDEHTDNLARTLGFQSAEWAEGNSRFDHMAATYRRRSANLMQFEPAALLGFSPAQAAQQIAAYATTRGYATPGNTAVQSGDPLFRLARLGLPAQSVGAFRGAFGPGSGASGFQVGHAGVNFPGHNASLSFAGQLFGEGLREQRLVEGLTRFTGLARQWEERGLKIDAEGYTGFMARLRGQGHAPTWEINPETGSVTMTSQGWGLFRGPQSNRVTAALQGLAMPAYQQFHAPFAQAGQQALLAHAMSRGSSLHDVSAILGNLGPGEISNAYGSVLGPTLGALSLTGGGVGSIGQTAALMGRLPSAAASFLPGGDFLQQIPGLKPAVEAAIADLRLTAKLFDGTSPSGATEVIKNVEQIKKIIDAAAGAIDGILGGIRRVVEILGGGS